MVVKLVALVSRVKFQWVRRPLFKPREPVNFIQRGGNFLFQGACLRARSLSRVLSSTKLWCFRKRRQLIICSCNGSTASQLESCDFNDFTFKLKPSDLTLVTYYSLWLYLSVDSMSPARVLGALNSISRVLTDITCWLKPSAGQQLEREVENRQNPYWLPGPLKVQAIMTHNEVRTT